MARCAKNWGGEHGPFGPPWLRLCRVHLKLIKTVQGNNCKQGILSVRTKKVTTFRLRHAKPAGTKNIYVTRQCVQADGDCSYLIKVLLSLVSEMWRLNRVPVTKISLLGQLFIER